MKSKFLHLLNDKLVKLVNLVMQSLKATKRQSDTTIFAESVKVSKFHETFAKSLKSLMSIFSNRGVKDVRVSLGQYRTNIQRISNLYLTPNRYFTRFAAVFALVFVLGVGNVLGAETTYTFSSKSWAASPANWTSGKDGNGYNNGIQVTTGVTGANGTSPVSFTNVTSITVYYHQNSSDGVGNIKVKVGSGTEQTFSVSKPSKGTGGTQKNHTFTFSPYETGNVKLTVNCTSNSIYIESITITTAASGYSITYHCNGATSGCPSNASGQTKLPATLPTPSKTGCTFAGWYTNEGLTTAATAGATLSADANLYAKWTTNVTLNRNGVTETINDVVVGTDLDEIDGSGDQGGCSAWTFVGWSKTQRAAQNVSTEMTLVTEVDGPGPYYAVYSHTESGGTTDLSKTETFENQSESTTYNSTQNYNANSSNASIAWTMYYGTVSTNAVLTDSKSAQMRWYSSAKSNIPYIATTTPISGLQTLTFNAAVGNTNIKMKVEKSTDGSTWTAVATNITMTTSKDDYSVDINGTIGTNYYIKIGVDGGNSTAPSSGNYTFRVDDVKFDYTASGGSTTYYSTTASCCEPLAQINGSINLSHF